MILGRNLWDDSLGWRLGLVGARLVLEHFGFALFFFLGLSLAGVALRRSQRGAFLAGPVAAFYAFFTWAFVTLRLPTELFVRPELESARGQLANGAAALLGILLASLVLLAAFVPARVARLSRGLSGLGLVLLVLVLGLRTVSLVGPGKSERLNILLISIDTLRADHLAAYGYGRETAPNLTAFGSTALRFDKTFTNHPWTLTSHATMLTGMLPTAHGVTRTQALDPRVPTVAGLLLDAGYRTFGVVDSNEWLNPRYGYAQGFARYERLDGDGSIKVEELLACIDDAASLGAEPFFGFAHFYDVHSDWEALPYDSELVDRERFAGWYEGDFTGCDEELGCASEYLVGLNARGEQLEGDDLRYVRDLYDAGISTFDRQLGALFEGLEERGLFDNTIVIVTSDHGEEFFDHGQALHGQHYDECMRVPLWIRAPAELAAQPGGSRDELSGLVDLAPTILDFAGLEPSSVDSLQGRSLAPLVLGRPETLAPEHPILFDTGNGIFGLRTPRFAVIRGTRVWKLFDTDEDPLELTDLYSGRQLSVPQMRDLRTALRERREATVALGERFAEGPSLEDVEADAAAHLAKLGYVDEDQVPVDADADL